MDAARKAQFLSAFDRSGLSAAAFAREHGIRYSTFCGWRYKRAAGKASSVFVQVELPKPAAPAAGLLIDLGAKATLHLSSEAQIPLAAKLLQTLNASLPC
jgi:hypothetical protein